LALLLLLPRSSSSSLFLPLPLPPFFSKTEERLNGSSMGLSPTRPSVASVPACNQHPAYYICVTNFKVFEINNESPASSWRSKYQDEVPKGSYQTVPEIVINNYDTIFIMCKSTELFNLLWMCRWHAHCLNYVCNVTCVLHFNPLDSQAGYYDVFSSLTNKFVWRKLCLVFR
jgi:hypothetical protein